MLSGESCFCIHLPGPNKSGEDVAHFTLPFDLDLFFNINQVIIIMIISIFLIFYITTIIITTLPTIITINNHLHTLLILILVTSRFFCSWMMRKRVYPGMSFTVLIIGKTVTILIYTMLSMREPTQVAPGAAGSGLCRLLGQVIQHQSSQCQNQCPPSTSNSSQLYFLATLPSRHRIEGYGHTALTTEPGCSVVVVDTWRPASHRSVVMGSHGKS